MKRVQRKKVTTFREILQKEMERLQKLKKEDNKGNNWWNTGSNNWARDEFGNNLDTITPLAIEREQEYCQICGKALLLDEKFIKLGFSFCDEYDCDMNICKTCLSSMGERINE